MRESSEDGDRWYAVLPGSAARSTHQTIASDNRRKIMVKYKVYNYSVYCLYEYGRFSGRHDHKSITYQTAQVYCVGVGL